GGGWRAGALPRRGLRRTIARPAKAAGTGRGPARPVALKSCQVPVARPDTWVWAGSAPERCVVGTDAWHHPEAGQLRAFAAGALGDEDLDRIAEHLDVCGDCRAAVDGFLVGDGFLDRLRTATTLGGDVPEGQAERRRAARALGREVRRSARAVPG